MKDRRYLRILVCVCFGALSISCGPNRVERGESLLELGEYEQAIELANEAIKDDPKNADAYFLKGKVLLSKDQRLAAGQALEIAIEVGDEETSSLARQHLLSKFETEFSVALKTSIEDDGANSFRDILAADQGPFSFLSGIYDQVTLQMACSTAFNVLVKYPVYDNVVPYIYVIDYFEDSPLGKESVRRELIRTSEILARLTEPDNIVLGEFAMDLLDRAEPTFEEARGVEGELEAKGLLGVIKARETVNRMGYIITNIQLVRSSGRNRQLGRSFPTVNSIQELETYSGCDSLIEKGFGQDAWGNPFTLIMSSEGFLLYSPGADGIFKTKYDFNGYYFSMVTDDYETEGYDQDIVIFGTLHEENKLLGIGLWYRQDLGGPEPQEALFRHGGY